MFKLLKKNQFVNVSYEITDKTIWNKFLSNPDFPYLISFPRTGSHWLRNVMELYFEKPSLMRVFYYKKPKDFTCFHIHDQDLTFNEDRRVIYLFREPVATIFSQMNYYQEDLNDLSKIIYWSNLYGKHLDKWLFNYDYSKKLLLKYENLVEDFAGEFTKVTDFFGTEFNEKKLLDILKKVSKEKIRNKVKDDKNVIKQDLNYKKKRKEFIDNNSELIMKKIYSVNPKLINHF